MRTTTPDHKYWLDENDSHITLGFTEDYLKALGVVWVIMPTDQKRVLEGEAFAHIESSKFLGPLRLPLAGVIHKWNTDIVEHPEVLTSENFLVILKKKEKTDESLPGV